jgi:hypothetical protein
MKPPADMPEIEFHPVDSGHFALEEHCAEIGSPTRAFLARVMSFDQSLSSAACTYRPSHSQLHQQRGFTFRRDTCVQPGLALRAQRAEPGQVSAAVSDKGRDRSGPLQCRAGCRDGGSRRFCPGRESTRACRPRRHVVRLEELRGCRSHANVIAARRARGSRSPYPYICCRMASAISRETRIR